MNNFRYKVTSRFVYKVYAFQAGVLFEIFEENQVEFNFVKAIGGTYRFHVCIQTARQEHASNHL